MQASQIKVGVTAPGRTGVTGIFNGADFAAQPHRPTSALNTERHPAAAIRPASVLTADMRTGSRHYSMHMRETYPAKGLGWWRLSLAPKHDVPAPKRAMIGGVTCIC
jgi:hypothetical protein